MDNADLEATGPNYYGLISRERADKFDLLGQLILNQREAIVVCGPEGIGKTTLLNTFKKVRESFWPICLLQGTETLDLAEIQNQIVLTIQQHHPELITQDLHSALSFCEQRQQKVALIIDDASSLAAGLINNLREYELQHPALRIVFAFTKEQLYLKNTTDKTIDDCYFMEIPALTLPQLSDFLQNPSILPIIESDGLEINDRIVNQLYRRTSGVPGNVITELQSLNNPTIENRFSLLKVSLLAGIVCLSGVLFYLHNRYQNNSLKSQAISSVVQQKPVRTAIKPTAQNTFLNKTQKTLETAKVAPVLATKPELQYQADEQWVLQQQAGYYTLQLMALSKRQPLLNIIKQHQNLQTQLKILQVRRNYVLVYGSFADTKTATDAVKLLPAEFRSAWPRRFNSVQQDIKNRTTSLSKQLPQKQ